MIVRGRSYRTFPATAVQLSVLRKVKAEFGFGWSTIQTYIRGVDEETPLLDVIGDPEFCAWMWAWILNAGDDMPRAELDALTIEDIEFTTDAAPPGDGGEGEADPTSAPTGSGRGAAPVPKRPTSRGSRTSRPRSTGG